MFDVRQLLAFFLYVKKKKRTLNSSFILKLRSRGKQRNTLSSVCVSTCRLYYTVCLSAPKRACHVIYKKKKRPPAHRAHASTPHKPHTLYNNSAKISEIIFIIIFTYTLYSISRLFISYIDIVLVILVHILAIRSEITH